MKIETFGGDTIYSTKVDTVGGWTVDFVIVAGDGTGLGLKGDAAERSGKQCAPTSNAEYCNLFLVQRICKEEGESGSYSCPRL